MDGSFGASAAEVAVTRQESLRTRRFRGPWERAWFRLSFSKGREHPLLSHAERAFDNLVPIKHLRAIELYRDNSCALDEAHLRYGGSQGLLRCAAQSVADAGRGDDGEGARESGDDEIRALRQGC